jgi:hypothetical protein
MLTSWPLVACCQGRTNINPPASSPVIDQDVYIDSQVYKAQSICYAHAFAYLRFYWRWFTGAGRLSKASRLLRYCLYDTLCFWEYATTIRHRVHM